MTTLSSTEFGRLIDFCLIYHPGIGVDLVRQHQHSAFLLLLWTLLLVRVLWPGTLFLAYEIEQTLSCLMCKLCQNNSRWLDYSTTWRPLILCACSYTTSHQSFPPGKVQSMPSLEHNYLLRISLFSYWCSYDSCSISRPLKVDWPKKHFVALEKKKKLKKDLKSLLAHWAKRWLDSLDQWQILIALGIGLVDFLNSDWSNYLITGFVFSILCRA